MLNFSVGPVQMAPDLCDLGANPVPYFRTAEFSQTMLENERMLLSLVNAPSGSRAVFLTGSGTAAMEAAVMAAFTPADRVLAVNGGSFGARFVQLCQIHGVPVTQIELRPGQALTPEHLAPYEGQGYTGFLVNLCETSTGVAYDARLIHDFCDRNGLFLIADAISAFLADPVDMADMLLTGSQKALACPPGVSAVMLSPRAVERAMTAPDRCLYLSLREALVNGQRGQTPFTPAVGILLQIHERLRQIVAAGGAQSQLDHTALLARDFRARVADLPFQTLPETPSNAVTALMPRRQNAYAIFETLKDEYGIWVCPNGGALRDRVFRVGHLGALTPGDNAALEDALRAMLRRGML